MKMFNTTEKRMNEIVFANRNKEYGAYAIRTTYDSTVTRSLGFVAGLTMTLLLITFIYSKLNPLVEETIKSDGQVYVEVPFNATPETKKPEVKSAAPKSNAEVAPKIADNANETNKKPADPNTDPKGDPNGKIGGTGTSTDSSAIVTKEPEVKAQVKVPEIEKMPDQLPEFAGLIPFLSSNIHYPQLAKEAGVSGTVFMNFIIDEEGNIESYKVIKSVGYGCDEEALRVIAKMPKWKPGYKDGKPVKTTFNLPIRFVLK